MRGTFFRAFRQSLLCEDEKSPRPRTTASHGSSVRRCSFCFMGSLPRPAGFPPPRPARPSPQSSSRRRPPRSLSSCHCSSGDEQLARLRALERPHDAALLHLVDDARRAGIAELQAPLEHGNGRLSGLHHHVDGGGEQLVALVGDRLGSRAGGCALAALFLLGDRLLDLVDHALIVLRGAVRLDEADHAVDLLGGDEAALHAAWACPRRAGRRAYRRGRRAFPRRRYRE